MLLENTTHVDIVLCLNENKDFTPTVRDLKEFLRVLDSLGFSDNDKLFEANISIQKIFPSTSFVKIDQNSVKIITS